MGYLPVMLKGLAHHGQSENVGTENPAGLPATTRLSGHHLTLTS